MCIMEVRPGQHHSTIAQAQAHNVKTVVGDLEMFETLLRSRGILEHPSYYRVGNLRNDLNEIYERLLSLWGDFLEREIDPNEIASLKREGKSVREILQEMIHADENHAHHYETR